MASGLDSKNWDSGESPSSTSCCCSSITEDGGVSALTNGVPTGNFPKATAAKTTATPTDLRVEINGFDLEFPLTEAWRTNLLLQVLGAVLGIVKMERRDGELGFVVEWWKNDDEPIVKVEFMVVVAGERSFPAGMEES